MVANHWLESSCRTIVFAAEVNFFLVGADRTADPAVRLNGYLGP